MGVFGAGNSGSALTKVAAPAMILAAGGSWQVVPEYYSYAMALTAVIFWFTSYHDPKHIAPANTTSFKAMFQLLKDEKVLRYSQYYSVVFGGYVGLALWMTKYYIAQYGFTMQTAALLAACFSLPGGVLRALGGWISDKYGAYKTTWGVMWVALTCLFIMSYPNTQMSIETVNGARDFHLGLSVVPFTVLLFVVGIATAVGKASVFKFISDDYTQNIGAVSGIVGLAGGLGGFLLPIMFGALVDLTGVRTSCFMLLFGTVCVSMIWMHWAFRRESMQAAQAALAAKG